MDVKNTHSVTKTEISVFGRQALDAERRRSPSLADKVLTTIDALLYICLCFMSLHVHCTAFYSPATEALINNNNNNNNNRLCLRQCVYWFYACISH